MVPRGLVGYMLRGSVLMLSELRLYALMEVGEKDEPRAAERERERERGVRREKNRDRGGRG